MHQVFKSVTYFSACSGLNGKSFTHILVQKKCSAIMFVYVCSNYLIYVSTDIKMF